MPSKTDHADELRTRELDLIWLTDAELVRQVYDTVGRLEDAEGSDALYWLLTEAFERWAFHAEWESHERYAVETWPTDLERRELELAATFEVVRKRAAARLLVQAGRVQYEVLGAARKEAD